MRSRSSSPRSIHRRPRPSVLGLTFLCLTPPLRPGPSRSADSQRDPGQGRCLVRRLRLPCRACRVRGWGPGPSGPGWRGLVVASGVGGPGLSHPRGWCGRPCRGWGLGWPGLGVAGLSRPRGCVAGFGMAGSGGLSDWPRLSQGLAGGNRACRFEKLNLWLLRQPLTGSSGTLRSSGVCVAGRCGPRVLPRDFHARLSTCHAAGFGGLAAAS